jgi:hypothetical protein
MRDRARNERKGVRASEGYSKQGVETRVFETRGVRFRARRFVVANSFCINFLIHGIYYSKTKIQIELIILSSIPSTWSADDIHHS